MIVTQTKIPVSKEEFEKINQTINRPTLSELRDKKPKHQFASYDPQTKEIRRDLIE